MNYTISLCALWLLLLLLFRIRHLNVRDNSGNQIHPFYRVCDFKKIFIYLFAFGFGFSIIVGYFYAQGQPKM